MMTDVLESLSPMDEAMLVRGLKGQLRYSKSAEHLVELGLFDDMALELTKEGRKVAKMVVKLQEQRKLDAKEKPHVVVKLEDLEVKLDDELFDDDIFEDDEI